MNIIGKSLISAAAVAGLTACTPERVTLSTESGIRYNVAVSQVDDLRNAAVVTDYFNNVTVANDTVQFDPRRSSYLSDPDEGARSDQHRYAIPHGDLIEVFDFSAQQRYVIDRERNLSSIVQNDNDGITIGEYVTVDFADLSPDLIARAEEFRAYGTGNYREDVRQLSEPFIFDNE